MLWPRVPAARQQGLALIIVSLYSIPGQCTASRLDLNFEADLEEEKSTLTVVVLEISFISLHREETAAVEVVWLMIQ